MTARATAQVHKLVKIAGIVLPLALACAGDVSNAPVVSVAGVWSGTATHTTAGSGAITLSLSQSGTSITGTWTTTFQDPTFGGEGTLTGVLAGAEIIATLSPRVLVRCPAMLDGRLSGEVINGTVVTTVCPTTPPVLFSITKH